MDLAVALASWLAVQRTRVDIFPDLGSPAVYIAQPYGGLDPQQMEGRLTQTSLADSLLPGAHKAKLWNLYEEIYGQIATEAATDFHALIGAEFLRGYLGNAPSGPQSGSIRR